MYNPTQSKLKHYKTSSQIKRTQIKQLIFYDSDEQQIDQIQRQNINEEIKYNKKQIIELKNKLYQNSTQLKPNLFNSYQNYQNYDDYQSSIRNNKHHQIQDINTIQSINIVKKQDRSTDIGNKIQINNGKNKHRFSNNIHISNRKEKLITFIQSEEEEQPEKQTKEQPKYQTQQVLQQPQQPQQPYQQPQQPQQSLSPIHPNQSNSLASQTLYDLPMTRRQLQFEQQQQKYKEYNIINLNQQIRQQSLYFISKLNENNHFIKQKLMYEYLHKNTKQIFNIQIYKNLNKIFELRYDDGNSLRLLLKGQKYLLIQKTYYIISIYHQNQPNYTITCRLQSNFDRSIYNLIKINKKQLIGTIINSGKTNNRSYLTLYYPKINKIDNNPYLFSYQQNGRWLNSLIKQQQDKIDYIITTKLPIDRQKQKNQIYGIIQSKRNMEFKGLLGDIKIIIGKQNTNRYKIISAEGINPIQIFCIAIVDLEI